MLDEKDTAAECIDQVLTAMLTEVRNTSLNFVASIFDLII